MVEGTTKFTAQEFMDKLRHDEIMAPLTVTGMVKVSDDDYNQIMFALGTQCADWTSVPLDLIESVEVLGSAPCEDHSHPLVALTFKKPESSEGAVFTALLGAAVQRPAINRSTPSLLNTIPRRVHTRHAKLRSDVLLGPQTPNPGGCAAACNEYEIFDDGVIRPLVSCRDLGGGSYICFYD
jgi:hypothetical protein